MLTAIRAVENIVDGTEPRPLGGQRRVRLPRGGRQDEQPYQRAPETQAMREPLVSASPDVRVNTQSRTGGRYVRWSDVPER